MRLTSRGAMGVANPLCNPRAECLHLRSPLGMGRLNPTTKRRVLVVLYENAEGGHKPLGGKDTSCVVSCAIQ